MPRSTEGSEHEVPPAGLDRVRDSCLVAQQREDPPTGGADQLAGPDADSDNRVAVGDLRQPTLRERPASRSEYRGLRPWFRPAVRAARPDPTSSRTGNADRRSRPRPPNAAGIIKPGNSKPSELLPQTRDPAVVGVPRQPQRRRVGRIGEQLAQAEAEVDSILVGLESQLAHLLGRPRTRSATRLRWTSLVPA